MNRHRLQKVATHVKENGGMSLAKGAFNAANFSQNRALAPVVKRISDAFIVESEELKSEYASRWWELEENLDGLHPKLNEEIAPLQDDPSVEFNYWPRFAFRQPFVAEVPNVTVVGPDAVPITSDGRCLLDPVNSVQTENRRIGGAIKGAISDSPAQTGASLLWGNAPETEQTESVAALLHSYWGTNYYHWMAEELPKLRGIRRYERETGRDVTLVVPSDPPSYITESLELLGYTADDYIEWDGRSLNVERLVVPSFPDLTPKTLNWLRDEISRVIEIPDADETPDWVYVSRQKASLRRVTNYEDVESVLDDFDVVPVFCEDISVGEQIKLFSTVEGIVGPHGAGLTGMMWSSDVQVVELFNNVVQSPFYVLAHVLGHEYTAVASESVGETIEKRNRNMALNKQDLSFLLEEQLEVPNTIGL